MERWRARGWRTGFTYGCFDPLHAGHIHLLQQARAACDRLVVAVTCDAAAPTRRDGSAADPEETRAARLAKLPGVDLVVIGETDGPIPLLQILRPDVLVTGAAAATGDPAEAGLLGQWGGQLLRAQRLPEPA